MTVQTGDEALILMYHRIAQTDMDPWGMCVGPGHFSEQLEAIRTLGTPLGLLEYVHLRKHGELPSRPIVLTFDDGYLDNLEQALPLLERHAVPATIFITTGNIGSEDEFWWDWLEAMLLRPAVLPDRLVLTLPTGDASWELGESARYDDAQRAADRWTNAWRATPGSRLRLFYDVWKRLWPLDPALRRVAMLMLADWSGVRTPPALPRRTMTATEIGKLSASEWIEIGAHTVAHPPLPAHPVEVQSREILDSQRVLQEITGAAVRSFAYPHGEYTDATIEVLHAGGFECAVTVEQKLSRPSTDAMKLPRFGVKDIDGEAFLAQFAPLFAAAPDVAA